MNGAQATGAGLTITGFSETITFVYNLARPFGWPDLPPIVAGFAASIIGGSVLWAVRRYLTSPQAE